MAGFGGTDGDAAGGWRVGDVVDGRYEVLRVHGDGGMGLVHRVRHLGWGTDLAVKSPRAELFRDRTARLRFVAEAENWVSLGLHPHVCGCHYVRTIDGVPRIFAEYITGGSLREWIDDGRLYEGGPAPAAARMMDLAVQIAWGLEHAHSCGLVHQDVKPANVLLEQQHAGIVAKVTDFGLARAKSLPATEPGAPAGTPTSPGTTLLTGPAGTLLATGIGMTPAYASPEQGSGQRVGRRSDVFSFAVTVLEMFNGGVSWMSGAAAGAALQVLRQDGPDRAGVPELPEELADLLARCLRLDPARRPGSMDDVAGHIADLYGEVTGRTYPRTAPAEADLRADELNNRALSLLDLGRTKEADQALAEALAADPRHPQATYNAGLLRWRRGAVTDEGLLAELEALRGEQAVLAEIDHLAGLVHLERGDLGSANEFLTDDGEQPAQALRLPDARTVAERHVPWQTFPHRSASPEHRLRITPDLRFGLAAGQDRTVQLWDLNSGRRLLALPGHTDRIDSADISADGRYAVSTGWDGSVRLWDLTGERLVRTVPVTRWRDGTGPAKERAFDRQNELNRLAGRPFVTRTLAHPDSPILNTATSPVRLNADGSVAVWAEADGRIQVWNLPAGRRLATLDGHSGGQRVDISSDGRQVLSGNGTENAVVQLWDLTTGACVWRRDDYEGRVADLWLAPRGDAAAIVGQDKVVRIWSLPDGECRHTLRLPTDFHATSAELSADGRSLLIGGYDGAILYWDLRGGHCLRTFRGHEAAVGTVRHAQDGRHAFSAALDGSTRLWRLPAAFTAPTRLSRPRGHGELDRTDQQVRRLLAEAADAVAADRTADALALLGRARALPGSERDPRILAALRALAGRTVRTAVRAAWPARTLDARPGEYRDVINSRSTALTRDARLGAYSDVDGRIQIWNLLDGRRERILDRGKGGVHALRVSPDDKTLVAVESDMITTWSLESGEHTGTLRLGRSYPITLSVDARLALVVDRVAGSMCLWEIASGRRLQSIPIDNVIVGRLSLGPDGKHAASMANDRVIRVWDLHAARCVQAIQIGSPHSTPVCLSPDGTFVVAAEASAWATEGGRTVPGSGLRTRIQVWDTATGDLVRAFEPYKGMLSHLALSADGRHLASAGVEPDVRLWEVATGRLLHTLEGHKKSVTALTLDPDANFVLTADRDERLRLWELDWSLSPGR
ncbi:WD40 repeat domain-containing serine/threonine protein kinase [Streptomyces sp. NPDC053750]|uniref:WD40 repeat domain-containing serine/threonine protein kinase n=1 Tax=Streptomyces sp. NPDC053750 TaxID=3365714 RepID=UPI0037D6FC27